MCKVITIASLVGIHIINITVELPTDITDIPQIYEVNCAIAGKIDRAVTLSFTYDTNTIDVCTTTDFNCTIRTISDSAPNPLRHGLLTVTWEAENINIGNNDGDHRISCSAKSNNTTRTSEYITVRGNSLVPVMDYIFLFILAPSSSPSGVRAVSICATNITVNWMYDTSDADGYVVYYNDTAELVVGGDAKETTLDGLIPGTSYSITVRAYQDILGPPSSPLKIYTIESSGG